MCYAESSFMWATPGFSDVRKMWCYCWAFTLCAEIVYLRTAQACRTYAFLCLLHYYTYLNCNTKKKLVHTISRHSVYSAAYGSSDEKYWAQRKISSILCVNNILGSSNERQNSCKKLHILVLQYAWFCTSKVTLWSSLDIGNWFLVIFMDEHIESTALHTLALVDMTLKNNFTEIQPSSTRAVLIGFDQ